MKLCLDPDVVAEVLPYMPVADHAANGRIQKQKSIVLISAMLLSNLSEGSYKAVTGEDFARQCRQDEGAQCNLDNALFH